MAILLAALSQNSPIHSAAWFSTRLFLRPAMEENKPNRWKIVGGVARLLEFFNTILTLPASSDMQGLGLEKDGELVAAVIYEGFNGRNIFMHVAAVPGSRWMTRDFVRYVFHYPFNELGVDRITGYVDASNAAARRLDEHLGFKPEAVLHGASPDGGDMIFYVLRRSDFKHANPK